MLSVSTINNSKLSVGLLLLLSAFNAKAQENSPFSRYGLGDIMPSQNIIHRSLGGASAAYIDGQSINFMNPASYGGIRFVTYDIGITVDSRTLKNPGGIDKYNATNFEPAYMSIGLPLSQKRKIGLALGLKPISKISYSILETTRLSNVDSLVRLYDGSGGLNQAFIGVGKTWKNFSAGFNTGYLFGRKQTNTRTFLINDTVPYFNGNHETSTSFNHLFIEGGVQYLAKLTNKSQLTFGAAGSLKQKLTASQDIVRETFAYNSFGSPFRIDSVFVSANNKGTIQLPSTIRAGIALNTVVTDKLGNKLDKGMIIAEYEATNWTDYRFYDKTDKVVNSWKFRLGGQLTPNPLSNKNYWSRVTYRTGFYFGKEQVNADGKDLPVYAVTGGASFPIRKWRTYDNQFTTINTTFEFGKRGNNSNLVTENFFRFSVGLNLSDIWFIKRKYD